MSASRWHLTNAEQGATLLAAGLIGGIITAPLFDRVLTHHLALTIRCTLPCLAGCWVGLVFAGTIILLLHVSGTYMRLTYNIQLNPTTSVPSSLCPRSSVSLVSSFSRWLWKWAVSSPEARRPVLRSFGSVPISSPSSSYSLRTLCATTVLLSQCVVHSFSPEQLLRPYQRWSSSLPATSEDVR